MLQNKNKIDSDAFVKEVLQTFQNNEGNYRKTVRETGVNYPKLKRWVEASSIGSGYKKKSTKKKTAKKKVSKKKKVTKMAQKENLIDLVKQYEKLEKELANLQKKIVGLVS